ncbi:MAG: hypothetical protein PUC30_08335 [Lachnospiraceae bacterium]|nr:hypothetical protein [Lachnospiraceae bacterium]
MKKETMYGIAAATEEEKVMALYTLLTMHWGGLKELSLFCEDFEENVLEDAVFQQVPVTIDFKSETIPNYGEFVEAFKGSSKVASGVGEDVSGERYTFAALPGFEKLVVNFLGNGINRDDFFDAFEFERAALDDYLTVLKNQDIESSMREFLKIRPNAAAKDFYEEYRVFHPEVSKEKVIETIKKIHDEEGIGSVITELWIEKPLSMEDAEEAGREAIERFRENNPEASEFLKHFRFQVSDLNIEQMLDWGETIECGDDEVVELLHRRLYETKEDLIENEVSNIVIRYKEWLEEE